jgi:hypothetical protein
VRSALLVVFDASERPLIELRVEDHPQPAAELRRLLGLGNERSARGANSAAD